MRYHRTLAAFGCVVLLLIMVPLVACLGPLYGLVVGGAPYLVLGIYVIHHFARSRGRTGAWSLLGPIGLLLVALMPDRSRRTGAWDDAPPRGSFDHRTLRMVHSIPPWRPWPWDESGARLLRPVHPRARTTD